MEQKQYEVWEYAGNIQDSGERENGKRLAHLLNDYYMSDRN